jgi:hypothetical protein
MKRAVISTVLAGVSAAVFAAGNSVEVTLEDGPAPKGPRTIADAKALGIAEAQKDIKVGHLRVKDYGKSARPNETDPVTGYPIEYIGSWRDRTVLGDFEVAAYNRTMREWYAKHSKKHR